MGGCPYIYTYEVLLAAFEIFILAHQGVHWRLWCEWTANIVRPAAPADSRAKYSTYTFLKILYRLYLIQL